MMQDGYEAYYNEPSVVGHYKNPEELRDRGSRTAVEEYGA